nr:MAG TPA: hypothetical protein [Caudoviricetes sp.]
MIRRPKERARVGYTDSFFFFFAQARYFHGL